MALSERRFSREASSSLRPAAGGQIYRPVLLNVEIKGDQPLLFSVGLVPEYAPETDFIGDESGRVFHLIRIATRFRWEILEPFMRRAPRLRDGEARQIFCKQLKESILLIEAESERTGYLEQDNVIRAFEEPEDVALIERLYAQWYGEREELLQAVDEVDIEGIVSKLKTLKQANVDGDQHAPLRNLLPKEQRRERGRAHWRCGQPLGRAQPGRAHAASVKSLALRDPVTSATARPLPHSAGACHARSGTAASG